MNQFETILHGDFEAFDQLYRKYYPVVFKMQTKYYLRGFDQDDWLQEGRIVFFRSLEKFQEGHKVTIGNFFKLNFENHIRSLVRRQCAYKRQGDITAVSLEQKMDTQGETFLDYMQIEESQALDYMIIREKLEDAHNVLSSFERVTFEEYMDGKELSDIAEEYDVQPIRVRSAYDRAKKKIKSLIYD
ncbi:sigma-70 family RNA polymerase sigma factor [Enterococcus sp. BWB1-3]|uniref:sigma-70 family RNA polymerase sigma factor n=1 Tax=unclassified Enterococcus TaxID=2608891 RepID=UPI0019228D75|nr:MULTISPECIES: sigma-70 family RNA polymerase sigma factor [unclassified Enterococcus]MBL1229375.1 sigma-70 family RNA polymerase sigma factor [Enterococcus sp. BWB1-3]MCB5951298.1 sigma-70 family RNA polymerase sigma factor [Enterococcus sp. BWT-B8]MCB5956096.1 sigma-70 family RNA polymerase sigma factor [Enterococcus sp. CWB-B31]